MVADFSYAGKTREKKKEQEAAKPDSDAEAGSFIDEDDNEPV